MYCKVVDGEFSNFTDSPKGEGYFPIKVPTVNNNLPTKSFSGWKYKFEGTYVLAIPQYIERPAADRARREREAKEDRIEVTVGEEVFVMRGGIAGLSHAAEDIVASPDGDGVYLQGYDKVYSVENAVAVAILQEMQGIHRNNLETQYLAQEGIE